MNDLKLRFVRFVSNCTLLELFASDYEKPEFCVSSGPKTKKEVFKDEGAAYLSQMISPLATKDCSCLQSKRRPSRKLRAILPRFPAKISSPLLSALRL
jgi:hypothetical protein